MMKSLLISLLGISALGTVGSNALAADEATVASHDKQVVAYIRTWPIGSTPADMDAGKRWTAEQIRCDQLTKLNLSFGLIRNGTDVYIPDLEDRPNSTKTGTIPAFKTLWGEVAKLQQNCPKMKINLSVGGWGADGFSQLAMEKSTRAKFIKSVLAIVEKQKLDGVDIDWEYPVGPDWELPIRTHPRDRANYPALLEETRAALDKLGKKTKKRYELSVAVPATPWFGQKNDIIRIVKAVDFLKVMAYDLAGTWSKQTGHHANLYQRPDDPAWGGWSADQGMKIYLNYGIKPEKLLLGTAFYGRAWKGVENKDNGLFQKFASGAYEDGISWPDIKKLMEAGYTRYWDDVAKAPWLYNGDEMITYEDAESLAAKAAYAKEHKLGGIMIWEYAHDMDAELLKPLNAALAQ
ncbi:glycoside hydrolase family 18 protein [Chitinilyticum litopenaei]|uniref:chitinase n=2 Tax=Chitinilyticum piscinae TaxID=2866724 RepID=A0A8J7K7Q8_9NEIS|nr:glycoside hydrolase family 18 protein [Chitinilyticum piscinae]